VIERSHVPAIVVCALLLSAATAAQMRRQPGTSGPPPYDLKAEVTVTGTVVGTETLTPPDRPELTMLLLTVKGEKVGVFVGPTEWVVKQRFDFTKGAEAQVLANTGFRYPGGPAIQPRTIKIGKRTLTVRDANGAPLWERASS